MSNANRFCITVNKKEERRKRVKKMKITTGLQCHFSAVFVCQLFLCLCLSNSVLVARAKSLEHHHSHHPTKDTEYGGSAGDGNSCDSVEHYFNSLNVTVRPDINGNTGELHF